MSIWNRRETLRLLTEMKVTITGFLDELPMRVISIVINGCSG
jgi:hypothetical protein